MMQCASFLVLVQADKLAENWEASTLVLLEADKFAEKWEALNAVETTFKNEEDDKKKAEEETMKAEKK